MRNKNKPNRFTSLHSHDGFSTFDGLGYPQEHIDFVKENGMDAWCLTNHGHMNSFAHAYLHAEKMNKAGVPFKFVPGCEMYVHPDLDMWRVDYELNKARKKGDPEAIKTLLDQREQIVTPLTAIVDGNDETTNIEIGDGSSLTVENEEETKSGKFYDPVKRRHHLVVLPKTSVGLQRLFHLVSRGYLEGYYRFPRVDYKMLKEAAKGGHLLISTACLGGPMAYEVFKHLQQVEFDNLHASLLNDTSLMTKVQTGIGNVFDALSDVAGDENVKLELQFNKLPAQHLVNRAILQFADDKGLNDNLVVTCDSHYAHPDHWKERELYKKLGWLNYKEFDPSKLPKSRDELKCELYPKNAEQTWESYFETTEEYSFYNNDIVLDAIERTSDIVHHEIDNIVADKSVKLPSYVVPKGKTDDEALVQMCKEGLRKCGLTDKQYVNRLITELKVIKQKKFSKYFLTMKAILDVARKRMLIGPGRGSAAGSLVAYVLGLTNVDPIEYGLLFERFLSTHRQGAPDIDTDVADRDLLLELLREQFGAQNILPISNYNTFKLKSLVKDIARFYGIPFEEVNAAMSPVENDVKAATFKKGMDKNLFTLLYDDAIKYSKSFKDFIEKYPHIAEPISVLFKQNKALGRHAGGVIISENVLERMPVITARGEAQTPWVEGIHYKHLEEFGWIKFDLLGLETLRIIQRCIELILKRHEGTPNPSFDNVKNWFNEHMDPKVMDMNDQNVYENIYHSGKWGGIFQATQRGAQKLFMQSEPRSIIDIATLTSIYRPGPLSANVHKIYMKSKSNPESIDYKHPLIKQVLEPTFGAIIFQEQVMELCNVVAGFPQEDCDMIRRLIMKRSASKKDAQAKQVRELKQQFVSGAKKNGIDPAVADDLYEKILFFSGYGFNKSHAVSYAIDSYYCAWLMTYYEAEWLCAYMETQAEDPRKRSRALSEIKSRGYDIVNIDINYASDKWTIMPDKKFMPSFLTVKGVGLSAVEEITNNRPYNNIHDLLWNDDGAWKHGKFNKRSLENLIKVGAFNSLDVVGEDKLFSSYRHMHHIVVENNLLLKKKKFTIDDFHCLISDTREIEDWTRSEKIEMLKTLVGHVDISLIVSSKLRQELDKREVPPINKYNPELPIHWFIIDDIHVKRTRKNKPYLLLSILGENGEKKRMFCWGLKDTHQINLRANRVCIAKVDNGDFGFSTRTWDIRMID
jgi:DNA-directed DNA polymerase III PolC